MSTDMRINVLLLTSFVLALLLLLWGGFKETETMQIVSLVTTLSVTMAGFGIVAFQIGKSSNELRSDFIETSTLLLLSTLSGFFYLVYPDKTVFSFNFGEASIFIFFWAFILFLIILVDRRFNLLT
ncbi:MAG: hypothetical protein WDN10_04785 [bacterium]